MAASADAFAYLDAGGDRRWGLLPERLRERVGSESGWNSQLRAHALATQAFWEPSLGGDEAGYLEELLRTSREKGMLFPYHLASRLRVSAYEYYVELITELIRAEKSYDTIPNFTAADCMRLLRVGRNEFIHALNTCRSKGWLWKRRRGRQLLCGR